MAHLQERIATAFGGEATGDLRTPSKSRWIVRTLVIAGFAALGAGGLALCSRTSEDPHRPIATLEVPVRVHVEAEDAPIQGALVIVAAGPPWFETATAFLPVAQALHRRGDFITGAVDHGRGFSATDAAGRAVVRCVRFVPDDPGGVGRAPWPDRLEVGVYHPSFAPVFERIDPVRDGIERGEFGDVTVTLTLTALGLRRNTE